MVNREMRQDKHDGKPSKGLESGIHLASASPKFYSTGKLLVIAILYRYRHMISYMHGDLSYGVQVQYCRATLYTHGLSARRASTEGGRILRA